MTCIVCDSAGPYTPVFAQNGFSMVRCPSCRLVFQDPQPSDEVLAETYYFDAEWTRQITHELEPKIIERSHELLAMLRGAGVVPDGPVLDVGASSGAFLSRLREVGWEAVGVEIGPATAEAARASGLDVRTGTLAEVAPSLEPRSFGLVTFWDVLEHLRDPREELALARALLRPGGLLAATLPNVEGWYPRTTHRLLARRTGVWEYPELPVHLYDFSPRTLRRLLEGAGFEVVTQRTTAIPFWYYRWTSLSPGRIGDGRRARALRTAFTALHAAVYPAAKLADRQNAQFVLARVS